MKHPITLYGLIINVFKECLHQFEKKKKDQEKWLIFEDSSFDQRKRERQTEWEKEEEGKINVSGFVSVQQALLK